MRALVVALIMYLGSAGPSQGYDRTGAFAWGGTTPADTNDVFTWQGIVRDDATGFPKVLYDGVPHWNYVTLSLYGLQEYNRYVLYDRRASLRRAARVGDWLARHQPRDGGWRYDMRFAYPRLGTITPPWVAAQAQGNAISLLVRLYDATGRRRYLTAARKARRPFQRSVADHGVRRRFAGHVFFEGFPTAKPALPLEDFQLAILGLYDLAPYDRDARRLMRRGMRTLMWALPRYEHGGLPQFDLAHVTAGVPPSYSAGSATFNAGLLGLLGRLNRDATARAYAKRWKAAIK